MEYSAIGLMSGTSLDGLDVCYAKFSKNETDWKFKILKAETIPYPENWENRLRNAIDFSAPEILELHSEYGFFLSETVKKFISENHIENLDVVASHGHTVFHQPEKKFTLQIGDGRAIKILNKIPVVYDFRTQDVLMGGNGAPLVPIGDELLFSEFDACLNLGGFSNISFKKSGKRLAFDICPVNFVLNYFSNILGKKYDENGDFAKNGIVDFELLKTLNALDFYQKKSPKSLGSEWVNKYIFPMLSEKNPETVLATFTQQIADQISKIFNKFNLKKILITGGGTHNHFLVERIKNQSFAEIIIPEKEIIDFKEALIFALMGVLKLRGENNILSAATGSFEDHSSGIVV
ncbi:MAG: anhydro-N-acetylmuramic acid kinase [Flavobacteriaceae bacterium]|jgi:anhydro-N-acetylmuramic acid kinase|nr:anhydro-N-acetylmuramic acid kinase [Flavobacteriaceae bacterium]